MKKTSIPKLTDKQRREQAMKDKVREQAAVRAANDEHRAQVQQREIITQENHYVKSRSWGTLFFERYNILAKQCNEYDSLLRAGEIELLDGIPKTKAYLLAEAVRFKIEASTKFRDAWFAKQELNKLGKTDTDVDAAYEDYTAGQIQRESYDEKYKRNVAGGFVL